MRAWQAGSRVGLFVMGTLLTSAGSLWALAGVLYMYVGAWLIGMSALLGGLSLSWVGSYFVVRAVTPTPVKSSSS